jgi:hypothetical protein
MALDVPVGRSKRLPDSVQVRPAVGRSWRPIRDLGLIAPLYLPGNVGYTQPDDTEHPSSRARDNRIPIAVSHRRDLQKRRSSDSQRISRAPRSISLDAVNGMSGR